MTAPLHSLGPRPFEIAESEFRRAWFAARAERPAWRRTLDAVALIPSALRRALVEAECRLADDEWRRTETYRAWRRKLDEGRASRAEAERVRRLDHPGLTDAEWHEHERQRLFYGGPS